MRNVSHFVNCIDNLFHSDQDRGRQDRGRTSKYKLLTDFRLSLKVRQCVCPIFGKIFKYL